MTKSATVSKKPRKQQSPEFRSEALKLAERISVTAAARQLELYESQLYNWRSKIQQQKTSSERECQQRLKSGSSATWVEPLQARGLITRRLSNSNPARPYICRFSIFRRFTCPSTTPLLHLLVMASHIAAASASIPAATR